MESEYLGFLKLDFFFQVFFRFVKSVFHVFNFYELLNVRIWSTVPTYLFIFNFYRHTFSESGIYSTPDDTTYDGCLNYIKSLPMIPRPEVFGLHENADITKNNYETNLVPV